jgi:hypothetical protein
LQGQHALRLQLELKVTLPWIERLDLQHHEVVQVLMQQVLPKLELALQQDLQALKEFVQPGEQLVVLQLSALVLVLMELLLLALMLQLTMQKSS